VGGGVTCCCKGLAALGPSAGLQGLLLGLAGLFEAVLCSLCASSHFPKGACPAFPSAATHNSRYECQLPVQSAELQYTKLLCLADCILSHSQFNIGSNMYLTLHHLLCPTPPSFPAGHLMRQAQQPQPPQQQLVPSIMTPASTACGAPWPVKCH
jgi:hypothetical protein